MSVDADEQRRLIAVARHDAVVARHRAAEAAAAVTAAQQVRAQCEHLVRCTQAQVVELQQELETALFQRWSQHMQRTAPALFRHVLSRILAFTGTPVITMCNTTLLLRADPAAAFDFAVQHTGREELALAAFPARRMVAPDFTQTTHCVQNRHRRVFRLLTLANAADFRMVMHTLARIGDREMCMWLCRTFPRVFTGGFDEEPAAWRVVWSMVEHGHAALARDVVEFMREHHHVELFVPSYLWMQAEDDEVFAWAMRQFAARTKIGLWAWTQRINNDLADDSEPCEFLLRVAALINTEHAEWLAAQPVSVHFFIEEAPNMWHNDASVHVFMTLTAMALRPGDNQLKHRLLCRLVSGEACKLGNGIRAYTLPLYLVRQRGGVHVKLNIETVTTCVTRLLDTLCWAIIHERSGTGVAVTDDDAMVLMRFVAMVEQAAGLRADEHVRVSAHTQNQLMEALINIRLPLPQTTRRACAFIVTSVLYKHIADLIPLAHTNRSTMLEHVTRQFPTRVPQMLSYETQSAAHLSVWQRVHDTVLGLPQVQACIREPTRRFSKAEFEPVHSWRHLLLNTSIDNEDIIKFLCAHVHPFLLPSPVIVMAAFWSRVYNDTTSVGEALYVLRFSTWRAGVVKSVCLKDLRPAFNPHLDINVGEFMPAFELFQGGRGSDVPWAGVPPMTRLHNLDMSAEGLWEMKLRRTKKPKHKRGRRQARRRRRVSTTAAVDGGDGDEHK